MDVGVVISMECVVDVGEVVHVHLGRLDLTGCGVGECGEQQYLSRLFCGGYIDL